MTADEDYQRRMAKTISSIEAIRIEIDEAVNANREDDERQADEFAASARAGRLGPSWQKVQQRIDLEQTTLADVMSGADESTEARALRRDSQRNLSLVHDGLVEDAESDEDGEHPLAQLNQMQVDLAERLQGLRRIVEDSRGS